MACEGRDLVIYAAKYRRQTSTGYACHVLLKRVQSAEFMASVVDH